MAFRPRSKTTIVDQSATAVSGAADTNENTLATITIPAGMMGPRDTIRLKLRVTYTNNANNKTFRVRWSGGAGTVVWGPTRTTQAGSTTTIWVANRGATNSQVYSSVSNNDASTADGNAGGTTAVDTTAQTTLVITAQKANGADTVTLEDYLCEVIRP
jgi:hypothetical protein